MKKKTIWLLFIFLVSMLSSSCLGDYEGENTPTPYRIILPLSMMTVDGWKFTLTGFNIIELEDDVSDNEYLVEAKGFLVKYSKGKIDSGCLPSSEIIVEIKSQEGNRARKLTNSNNEDLCVNYTTKLIVLNFPINSLKDLAEYVGPFADVSLTIESKSKELIYLGQLGHLGDPKISRATKTPTPSYDGQPDFPIEVYADISGNPVTLEITTVGWPALDENDDMIIFINLINDSDTDMCIRPEDFYLEVGFDEIPIYESKQEEYAGSLGLTPLTHLKGLCVKSKQQVSSFLVFEIPFSEHKYDRVRIVFNNTPTDLGYFMYIKDPVAYASIPTETTFPSRTPEITPSATSTVTPTIPPATQTAQSIEATQTAISRNMTSTVVTSNSRLTATAAAYSSRLTATAAAYSSRLTATISARQTQVAYSQPPSGDYCDEESRTKVFCAGNFEYRNSIWPYSTNSDSHFVVFWVEFGSVSGSFYVTPIDITLVMDNNRQYAYHEATFSFNNHLDSMTVYGGNSVGGAIVFLVPVNSRPVKLIYDMGWLSGDLVIEID